MFYDPHEFCPILNRNIAASPLVVQGYVNRGLFGKVNTFIRAAREPAILERSRNYNNSPTSVFGQKPRLAEIDALLATRVSFLGLMPRKCSMSALAGRNAAS
ncbi:MAG: hypothetical protein AAGA71_17215 [Pseudomonadota bacterium]